MTVDNWPPNPPKPISPAFNDAAKGKANQTGTGAAKTSTGTAKGQFSNAAQPPKLKPDQAAIVQKQKAAAAQLEKRIIEKGIQANTIKGEIRKAQEKQIANNKAISGKIKPQPNDQTKATVLALEAQLKSVQAEMKVSADALKSINNSTQNKLSNDNHRRGPSI